LNFAKTAKIHWLSNIFMILQVICQHCQSSFDSDGLEKTAFCPVCGQETAVFFRPAAAPAPVATVFSAPAAPKDDLENLIITGYATAIFLPLVGFIIGIILLAKNRPGSGLTCILLSMIFAGIVLAVMSSL
jgi:hypothetical protein